MKIFTWYAWRDRMTYDTSAGDIYEATDKCPYCIGDRNESLSLIREEVDIYLHYNNLVAEYQTANSWGDVDKKINYCPMCGRKLEVTE